MLLIDDPTALTDGPISLTAEEKEKLLDEACAIVEANGGFDAFIAESKLHHKMMLRMNEMHDGLFKRYPDKWVALGEGDVIAVGDSKKDALDAIEKLGMTRTAVAVRFMDTNPPLPLL